MIWKLFSSLIRPIRKLIAVSRSSGVSAKWKSLESMPISLSEPHGQSSCFTEDLTSFSLIPQHRVEIDASRAAQCLVRPRSLSHDFSVPPSRDGDHLVETHHRLPTKLVKYRSRLTLRELLIGNSSRRDLTGSLLKCPVSLPGDLPERDGGVRREAKDPIHSKSFRRAVHDDAAVFAADLLHTDIALRIVQRVDGWFSSPRNRGAAGAAAQSG